MTGSIDKLKLGTFALLGLITTASVLAAFATELYYLALLPFGLIVVYLGITNFRFLYFLLLASIPVSIEYSFSSSLATDLPDEPLMIGLTLITFVYLAKNPKALPPGFFLHTLLLGVGAYLFWVFVSALNAIDLVVSVKVLLSKIWYITTFAVLTAIVIKTKEDIKTAFWCMFIPLTLLIIQVIVRHGLQGFSFEDINKPMAPFFRNHVNYAAMVVIFLPFVWYARTWYKPGSFTRRLLSLSVLLYLVAIYLSYTRTCYLAVMLIPPVVFVIKRRFMKPALVLAAAVAIGFVGYMMHDNKFLDYAPNFSETIIHDEFGDHLSSTFEGKDVSSMERVYRWVAVTQMWQDRPVFGLGPGNFYPYYMRYTLSSFETYVSDNPERSTTHNYFLFILAEQGMVGLAIFVLLTIVIFVWIEKIYHSVKSREDKALVLALGVVMTMIYMNLLLSDMLESDKVGPFFFMCIALLAAVDIRNRQLLKAQG